MESFPQDQSSALHQEDEIYATYPVSSKQEKPASLIGPVAQALSRSLRVSLQDIILQENSEKYRESATYNLAEQDALLREVFEIMWRLNEAALQDHRIGTLPGSLDLDEANQGIRHRNRIVGARLQVAQR